MFNLSQRHAANRFTFKCDYIRYTPPSLNLVLGKNNQIVFDIPREDSANSLKHGYLELDSILTHRAGAHAPNADGDYIGLIILGPIALFDKYRLTCSNGKEIEDFDNAHVIPLMYKLSSRSRASYDFQLFFTQVVMLEKEN